MLLEQIETGFFVGATAPLVLEEADARLFPSSLEALHYCTASGIRDVEILLRFSDPLLDTRLRPFQSSDAERPLRRFASPAERLACLQDEIAKRPRLQPPSAQWRSPPPGESSEKLSA